MARVLKTKRERINEKKSKRTLRIKRESLPKRGIQGRYRGDKQRIRVMSKKALALRIKGYSFQEIGDELETSRANAYRWVMRALEHDERLGQKDVKKAKTFQPGQILTFDYDLSNGHGGLCAYFSLLS